ncbi:hypothetical protein M5K25_024449 [Dendrobium thyrsiflorum]|uniref:Zinc knuckle CX2CX4HX4C domain-containing protein n=1 Tax=Dendrobium thyrsiflorum TaxID=117978 RepID=A0ABD0U1X7_DENTH
MECDSHWRPQAPNYRCGNLQDSSSIPHVATEQCPLGVCVFAAENQKNVQYVTLNKMSEETFLAKDGISMEPEVSAVQDNIAKLGKALVAKIIGRRVSFPYLLAELKCRLYHFEYEGLSNFCFHCGLIAHTVGSCSAKIIAPIRQSPTNIQTAPVPPKQDLPSSDPHNPPASRASPPIPETTTEQHRPTPEDEHSLGAWNVVTRRGKGKPRGKKDQVTTRAPKDQGTRQPAESPLQFSVEKLQQLEDTSNRIMNFRK